MSSSGVRPSFEAQKNPTDAAVEIGASSARLAETVSTWSGEACALCDRYRALGLEIVLTVTAEPQRRNPDPSGPAELGSRLPADMETYRRKLGEIIDARHPSIIAVENEPDGQMFWDDTPDHYLQLLAAACEVAHARGVACTDGGLTSGTVQIMTYQHYLDSGEPARAASYRSRLENRWTIPGDAEQRRARAEEGWSYLRRFAAAGADRANFHWYEPNPTLYAEAIPYLASEAQLPLLSNETGQLDELGTTTTGIMSEALRLGVRPTIWFSMDWYGPTTPARSLFNTDGSLRDSGRAYQAFTQSLLETAPAPEARITRGPSGKIAPRSKISFRFKERHGLAARFECSLKRPARRQEAGRRSALRYKPCRSPRRYREIRRPGRYVFKVRAISPAGVVERKPAKREFRVTPR